MSSSVIYIRVTTNTPPALNCIKTLVWCVALHYPPVLIVPAPLQTFGPRPQQDKTPQGSRDSRTTRLNHLHIYTYFQPSSIIIIIIIIIVVIISEETPAARGQLAVSGGIPQYCFSAGVDISQTGPVLHCMVISILHLFGLVVAKHGKSPLRFGRRRKSPRRLMTCTNFLFQVRWLIVG